MRVFHFAYCKNILSPFELRTIYCKIEPLANITICKAPYFRNVLLKGDFGAQFSVPTEAVFHVTCVFLHELKKYISFTFYKKILNKITCRDPV